MMIKKQSDEFTIMVFCSGVGATIGTVVASTFARQDQNPSLGTHEGDTVMGCVLGMIFGFILGSFIVPFDV